jgi:hypothetical protein
MVAEASGEMRRRDMTMCSFATTLGRADSSDACEPDVVSPVHPNGYVDSSQGQESVGATRSLLGE